MGNSLSLLRAVLLLVMLTGLANAQDVPIAPTVPETPARTLRCRALDALGHPIPNATIQTWHVPFGKEDAPAADILSSETDENGNSALPENDPRRPTIVRLVHPDYGIAESDDRFFESVGAIYFPLVRKGTEIESRALRGVVLDPENHPVAGARVTMLRIWAMGDWLSTATFKGKTVFTDQAGRFTFCPPVGPDEFTPCSGPVPPNSRFLVTVVQPDFALFPDLGTYRNSEEAVIRLVRPERFHRFVFLDSDGQPLASAEAERLTLYFTREGLKRWARLPANYSVERVKLAPGRYSVNPYGTGLPEIEVTEDSPEELVYRFPPPTTFVGRVVDGVTGKPLAGAFVMPGMPVMRPGEVMFGLAMLTEENWKAFHALPAAPNAETPRQIGDVQIQAPIVRTDAEGKYSITGQASWFWTLTVFDEDLLPFFIQTKELKADEHGRAALPDAPLFPAAKVLVTPVFDKMGESVFLDVLCLNWLLERAGQPEWFARFSQSTPRDEASLFFFYPGANMELLLYVPAGLRLRLSFQTLASGWAPREYPEPFLLAPGEVKKIEDLTFTPCFKAAVRVVDARGKPLAWIGVDRFGDVSDDEHDDLLPAQDTDSGGLAHFYMRPGSSGRFAVATLEKQPPAAEQAKAEVAFRIPAFKAPAEPFVITLSDQQLEQLSKLPPALK